MARPTDRPRIVRILGVTEETRPVTTLRFDDPAVAFPGQYVMVWVPGVDEVPMSLSYTGKRKGISVHAKGDATRALTGMKTGEKIGIRGPYGNGFTVRKGRALIVAGGTGMAALAPLVETLAMKTRPTVVIGARTRQELLFVRRVQRTGANTVITTDDGSAGAKGFTTDAASALLSKERYSVVYSCGPEMMMKSVVEMGKRHSVEVQVSLERYMKCGVGICDACAMSGRQLCIEGPVLDGKTASAIGEFGKWRRGSSGIREKL